MPNGSPASDARSEGTDGTAIKVTTYAGADAFLVDAQAELESNEATNSLMLGICGQLVRHPDRVTATPCLKTVADVRGLVLAAIMTPPHKLVVVGHRGDLDGGARILARELFREEWPVPGVLGPSDVAWAVAGRWAEVTGQTYGLERRQRVYELREVTGPVPQRGRLRPATGADAGLVARWWHEFNVEIFGEADQGEVDRAARSRIADRDIYLWDDGQPVSMAMKTRPTSRGIGVSLVYTPPALRRRGYATACVRELSRVLLTAGWQFCTLFADLSNPTPNRIYQRIGYRPVCDYDEYVFAARKRQNVCQVARASLREGCSPQE